MRESKTLAAVLIAALAVAAAGPAMAKKQRGDEAYAAQTQGKKKAKRQAGQNCFYTAPPFMRNPRFMNRGFFKKKCPGQDQ